MDQKPKDNKSPTPINRRSFLTKSALAVTAFSIVPRHVLGKGYLAPSDKINLGFIGLGKQSRGLSANFVRNGAEITACSDVWSTKNDWFVQHVTARYLEEFGLERKNSVKPYLDY